MVLRVFLQMGQIGNYFVQEVTTLTTLKIAFKTDKIESHTQNNLQFLNKVKKNQVYVQYTGCLCTEALIARIKVKDQDNFFVTMDTTGMHK